MVQISQATTFFCLALVLLEQTIATDADGVSRDLHCKHFLSLDVVVDGAAIYIDDAGGLRNPDYFYILATARTPNLFSNNEWWLYVNHAGSLVLQVKELSSIKNGPALCGKIASFSASTCCPCYI